MSAKDAALAAANVDIGVGFPETLRRAAARLYWDAFGRKLGAVMGFSASTTMVHEIRGLQR